MDEFKIQKFHLVQIPSPAEVDVPKIFSPQLQEEIQLI